MSESKSLEAPGISASVAVNVPGGSAKVTAWGGAFVGSTVSAAALGAILVFGDPQGNPAHFILAIISGVLVGSFIGHWTCFARLQDAKEELLYKREEIARITAVKAKLEDKILQRLSSLGGGKKGRQ